MEEILILGGVWSNYSWGLWKIENTWHNYDQYLRGAKSPWSIQSQTQLVQHGMVEYHHQWNAKWKQWHFVTYSVTWAWSTRSILFCTSTIGMSPTSFSTFFFHISMASKETLSVVEKARTQAWAPVCCKNKNMKRLHACSYSIAQIQTVWLECPLYVQIYMYVTFINYTLRSHWAGRSRCPNNHEKVTQESPIHFTLLVETTQAITWFIPASWFRIYSTLLGV